MKEGWGRVCVNTDMRVLFREEGRKGRYEDMVEYKIEDGSTDEIPENFTSPGRGWDKIRISSSGDGWCGESGIVRYCADFEENTDNKRYGRDMMKRESTVVWKAIRKRGGWN